MNVTPEYLLGLVRAFLEVGGVWDIVTSAVTVIVIVSVASFVIRSLRGGG